MTPSAIDSIGASTDSKVNRTRFMDHDFAAVADYGLLESAVAAARADGVAARVGNVFSSDLFYSAQPQMFDVMEAMGVLAVEMEIAGLYGVAAENSARALGILTVSDHIRRKEHMSPEQRTTSFDAMIHIALETAIAGS